MCPTPANEIKHRVNHYILFEKNCLISIANYIKKTSVSLMRFVARDYFFLYKTTVNSKNVIVGFRKITLFIE